MPIVPFQFEDIKDCNGNGDYLWVKVNKNGDYIIVNSGNT